MDDPQEIVDRCLKFGTPTYVAAADLIEQLLTESAELRERVAGLAVANSYLREALKEARAALGENND